MSDLIAEDADRVCARVDLTALSGARVLILGATGLLGTHLTRVAEAAGATVTAPKRPSFMDPDWREASCSLYDCVINAGGYGQPAKFLADKLATIEVNTAGTLALLRCVRPGGSFLFLSSSEVYSGCWRMEHTEEDIGTTTPWSPRAAYIEAKRTGEAIVAAARSAGVAAKVARVSLAYGPGTRAGDGRVLNQLIERAVTTGKVELLDEGLAVRCYVYISDAVEMLLNILLAGREGLYNVGGESYVSIAGLARMIAAETEATAVGLRHDVDATRRSVAGAPDHVRLDIGRYVKEFGRPEFVGLGDGLRRTVEWVRAAV